ncbi:MULTISPECIES: gluconokinase [unclassified Streptomyces]|uniref:gluconokinase n=1 Tax=unclassified Streptomyces TaxID=2593676 RepID=UPI002DDA0F5F|nr:MULTISPECIES: gluconokinase [unclassified Streptomyces]WSA97437.1 gluconokinase [Streptomyces sp. NBC_01795]WSB81863.1 gluconokinase [Streptomyces sp. NBC_01775]WSS17373.1 gluconokinase [Streptomyces sp. NBC_01186]WSS46117.1 gluconokinase [Streptomyces sp. NBC_01187]
MGVSGSGKSTVGELLAPRLGVPFADADSFHPRRNIEKMSAGTPLTDEDRAPWLASMADWLAQHTESGAVLVCSALKRRYRDRLRQASSRLFFLHLDGSYELIAGRLGKREGHFMPAGLLRSQFEALERLEADEAGAVVPVDGTVDQTTARARALAGGAPRG